MTTVMCPICGIEHYVPDGKYAPGSDFLFGCMAVCDECCNSFDEVESPGSRRYSCTGCPALKECFK